MTPTKRSTPEKNTLGCAVGMAVLYDYAATLMHVILLLLQYYLNMSGYITVVCNWLFIMSGNFHTLEPNIVVKWAVLLCHSGSPRHKSC